MRRFLTLSAAVVVISTVGCANARYVQKIDNEGVVAIPANSDAWPSFNRTNALRLIEEHVGPGYEIIEEREIKTGTATTNTRNTHIEPAYHTEAPFLPAEKQTTTTTTTASDLTEYHIHYRRKPGGSTGFPGTAPVVPALHTQPAIGTTAPAAITPAAATMPPTTTPTGVLPPPDLAGVSPQ